MDGVLAGDDPEINDVSYDAPSKSLVFYDGDVGDWNGIVRIGQLAGDDMPSSSGHLSGGFGLI